MGDESLPAEFNQPISGFAPELEWLMQHGLASEKVGHLFGINATHVRQVIWRARHRTGACGIRPGLRNALLLPDAIYEPVPRQVRGLLGIRSDEDSVVLDARAKVKLDELWERVEQLGTQFWSGVRFSTGLARFTHLLPLIGHAGRCERIRLLARLRQFISENHLHMGRTVSAINQGLASIHLSRVAHQESGSKGDLESLSRTARLVAQAHLLRREPQEARHYLEMHKTAARAGGSIERPEYFHQLAVAALQEGDDNVSLANLNDAMGRLRNIKDHGQAKEEHEVRDIGERAMNFLKGNWHASRELQEFMISRYSADDIHVSLNVAWTAASGFATDDSIVHRQAQELLHRHADAALGYGRQMSMYYLLNLTPRLTAPLRRSWARHVLYANALADE